MSAAPSASTLAISLEMMKTTARLTGAHRICQTAECHVRLRENGHRHCCTERKRTFGARHSGRCRDLQRRNRTTEPTEVGNRLFPCCTSRCARTTTGTYLHCCSYCANSGGVLHSVRCQNRRGVTYPTGTAGAAEAMIPLTTAATTVAGAGSEAPIELTAWNTAWPAPMATTEAKTNAENAKAPIDLTAWTTVWPAPMATTDAKTIAEKANDASDSHGGATRVKDADRLPGKVSRWSSRHRQANPTRAMPSEQAGASEATKASSKLVQDLQPVIDLEEMD